MTMSFRVTYAGIRSFTASLYSFSSISLPPRITHQAPNQPFCTSAAQDTLDTVTLEEMLEEKRKALPTSGPGATPVTAGEGEADGECVCCARPSVNHVRVRRLAGCALGARA